MAASGAISLLNSTGINTTALGTSADWELPAGAAAGIFVVKIANSSGFTSGFTFLIKGKDELTSTYYQINATPTAIAADGTFVYVIYPAAGTTPGSGSGITAVTNTCFIPPKGQVVLNRTDGTYDAKVSLTVLYGD